MEQEPKNEREALWQAKVRRFDTDAAEINRGIAKLGIPFELDQLAAVQEPYPEAIPLLLEHLEKKHSDDVMESMMRALRIPYGGRAVFDGVYRFLRRYRDEGSTPSTKRMSSHLAYTIGNTLAVVAEKSCMPALENVVADSRNGDARLLPLHRLAKWKSPAAVELAKRMLEQDDMSWYALRALRYAKVRDAAALARPYLAHENSAYRTEARRYFAMLEKPPTPPRPKRP